MRKISGNNAETKNEENKGKIKTKKRKNEGAKKDKTKLRYQVTRSAIKNSYSLVHIWRL